MKKAIVIIGAGISGLSLLHYLRKKYRGRPDLKIVLIEQSDRAGGHLNSVESNGCLFECGPSGFLAAEPATLELIEDLKLTPDVITADQNAKKRFFLIDGRLHLVPQSLSAFWSFKPLRFTEKLRILAEFFVPKGNSRDESVYDFIKRRFGPGAARCFADPIVSGVFAGNSHFLSMAAAFPKLYDLEQRHGSLLRAMIKQGRQFRSELKSFREGMGQLTNALAQAHGDCIRLNETVVEIIKAGEFYMVVTNHDKYPADEIFICSPAYSAGDLISKLNPDLSAALKSIDYAPLTVVGLSFESTALSKIPEGFGYLGTFHEQNPVLGVLIESNVYTGRAPVSHVLFRVMIGGVRHPECAQLSREELTAIALKEIDARYGVQSSPVQQFFKSYKNAIPQYETQHTALKQRINQGIQTLPHVHLLGNYLNGVAVNDCIRSAQESSRRLEI